MEDRMVLNCTSNLMKTVGDSDQLTTMYSGRLSIMDREYFITTVTHHLIPYADHHRSRTDVHARSRDQDRYFQRMFSPSFCSKGIQVMRMIHWFFAVSLLSSMTPYSFAIYRDTGESCYLSSILTSGDWQATSLMTNECLFWFSSWQRMRYHDSQSSFELVSIGPIWLNEDNDNDRIMVCYAQ